MAAPPGPSRRGAAWTRIADLTGLDLDLFDSAGLDRWIGSRSEALGLDRDDYAGRLAEDESERRLFSAQVAVPESWVGRYPASFDLIARIAGDRAATGDSLRVVSLGCAAGQELVSVALVAIDAGIPASRLDLHGVDRNAEAIARARAGLLPRLAMRGELAERWSSRFVRVDDGWRVPEDLHRVLRFHDADVLVDPVPVADASADLVLCRNVLIYLSPEARRRLVTTAVRLLSPEGTLLVGHADPPADLRSDFHAVDAPGAFAWRLGPSKAPVPRSTPSRSRPPRRTDSARPSVIDEGPASPPTIEEIRRLADEGRLDAARELGDRLLESTGSTPELECLLGEVASADDRPGDAREHWRRALYLDAGHAPSLQHLVLLYEASGEPEAAAIHRRRLDRLERGRESGR